MPQTQTQWTTSQIKQSEKLTGQAVLRDEHSLVLFSQDFSNLSYSKPSAVFIPETVNALQIFLQYANSHQLPVTIRGKGMSQNGQSLAGPDGVVISLENLAGCDLVNDNTIWIGANTSWTTLLNTTLPENKVPFVVPYNCELSLGGVLSAGGVGASSFRFGPVISQTKALEVVTADGQMQVVTQGDALFHACLGGQGQFGVITKACMALKSCHAAVKTFYLVYLDKAAWLQDMRQVQAEADYLECFCSPSIQGAKLSPTGRTPFAQWLYGMHVSIEYEEHPPELPAVLSPWKLLHCQNESMASYHHRHDSRFQAMKITGQWELPHVWFECFVSEENLAGFLDELLATLPLYYATVVQVVPVAASSIKSFFMMPDCARCYAVMVLNPGLPKALVPSLLSILENLNKAALLQGSKRYLSGYLGKTVPSEFLKIHYGSCYEEWLSLKQQYDPQNIFKCIIG